MVDCECHLTRDLATPSAQGRELASNVSSDGDHQEICASSIWSPFVEPILSRPIANDARHRRLNGLQYGERLFLRGAFLGGLFGGVSGLCYVWIGCLDLECVFMLPRVIRTMLYHPSTEEEALLEDTLVLPATVLRPRIAYYEFPTEELLAMTAQRSAIRVES